MYLLLLGVAVLILVSLFLAGLYVALQKRNNEEETTPQIHHSGVYRLRRSPREALLAAKPSEKELQEHLETLATLQPSDRIALLQLWRDQTELNMRLIEEADLKEVRTFQIEIPAAQEEARRLFPEGTYVTRDQLGAHAQLIPPFHLGCRAALTPRNAWEMGDWKPLLPASEGKYAVPDWRTIAR
jgi:hypothetical protein